MTFSDTEEHVMEKILTAVKREQVMDYIQNQNQTMKVLKFSNLEIHLESRKVFHHGTEVQLTYIQFEVLWLLARKPSRVFGKEQIYDIVWNEPYSGDYNIVVSHIHHIRKKIEDDPKRLDSLFDLFSVKIEVSNFDGRRWSD